MGVADRDYAREQTPGGPVRVYRGPGVEPLSVTTTIIIANVVVAFFTIFTRSQLANSLMSFGVMQAAAVLHGQVWRLFTATYLHGGFDHIFVNMLGLYFLGPALEKVWGPRQFFLVYTLGGVAGNILLTVAGAVGFINPQTLGVGASGSILTLLGAAAVLFPDSMVYVYFIFPLRIRTCVILYCIWYAWNVLQQGANYGGDLCHIAGLVFGVAWARSGGISISGRHRVAPSPTSMLRGIAPRRYVVSRPVDSSAPPRVWTGQEVAEIDRILAKITREGFASLTLEEKQRLADAARR